MRLHLHIHQAPFVHFAGGLFALHQAHSLAEQAHVHVIPHGLHVAVLLAAQNIPRAPYLQIPHGNLKPRPKLRKLPYSRKPLLGNLGQGLVGRVSQIRIGPAAASPHPAPQLVQLAQAQPVGVVDNKGVGRRHIHPGLNNRGAHQDVDLMVQLPPHLGKLFLVHFAVANADARLGHVLLYPRRRPLNRAHVVMQEIHLPAPPQLPVDGVVYDPLVVFQHIGLYRVPVVGGFLNYRHVPYARKGHVQRPGYGRSRQGQHVRRFAQPLKLLLLGHAKALLLVNNHKAQVLKPHVLAHQPVGSHNDIHAAPLYPAQNLLLLLRRAEPGQQLHIHREALHAF